MKVFSSDERFFIIASIEEGALRKFSSLSLHRVLKSLLKDVNSVKRLRDGSLLVEVKDLKQAEIIRTATLFHDVAIHYPQLVFDHDFMKIFEEEILEKLNIECAVGVKGIISHRYSVRIWS